MTDRERVPLLDTSDRNHTIRQRQIHRAESSASSTSSTSLRDGLANNPAMNGGEFATFDAVLKDDDALRTYLNRSAHLKRKLCFRWLLLLVASALAVVAVFFIIPRLPDVQIEDFKFEHVDIKQSAIGKPVEFTATANLTIDLLSNNVYPLVVSRVELDIVYLNVTLGHISRGDDQKVELHYGKERIYQEIHISSKGLAKLNDESAEVVGQLLVQQILTANIQWDLVGTIWLKVFAIPVHFHVTIPLNVKPLHYVPFKTLAPTIFP